MIPKFFQYILPGALIGAAVGFIIEIPESPQGKTLSHASSVRTSPPRTSRSKSTAKMLAHDPSSPFQIYEELFHQYQNMSPRSLAAEADDLLWRMATSGGADWGTGNEDETVRFSLLLRAWGSLDPYGAFTYLEKASESDYGLDPDQFCHLILRGWAKVDPEMALKFYLEDQKDSRDLSGDCFEVLAEELAQTKPARTIDLLLEAIDRGDIDFSNIEPGFEILLSKISSEDPQKALQIFEEHDQLKSSMWLKHAMVRGWMSHDFEAAVLWLEKNEPNAHLAISSIMRRDLLFGKGIEWGTRKVLSIKNREIRTQATIPLLRRISHFDVPEALKWLQENSNPTEHGKLSEGFLRNWINIDREAAHQWVSQLPEAHGGEEATVSFLRLTRSYLPPLERIELAMTLKDEEKKIAFVTQSMASLQSNAPDKARFHLDRINQDDPSVGGEIARLLSIPDETRRKILDSLMSNAQE